jgi:hypothetical protein
MIPKPEQEALQLLILQTEAARNKSRLLLDQAKRAVEIAIEENEDAAMEFLKGFQGASS